MIEENCFFTYAAGAKYLKLAFALARSYKFHNGEKIPFAIASPSDFHLPSDLPWVKKIIPASWFTGKGLEFKLHLIDIAPTTYSIFIDADSLIYGNIESLFETFDKTGPSVVGLKLNDGEWVDEDIASVCREYAVPYLIRYCGALYYIVKNDKGRAIFNYALDLFNLPRKFQALGQTINEEPLLSVALSKYKTEPLADDGNIWSDLVQFPYHERLNVFKRPPVFCNVSGKEKHKPWLPDGSYSPLILHVGSGNYNRNPWLFDALRLKLHYQYKSPVWLSDFFVSAIIWPTYMLTRRLLRKRAR
ncbi:hypothetical protein [Mucilaginibacter sp. L3T2-6]|uniref:hypothetical protein n=1 Tax=Mucilaginibacter sp. L3T2-6 TaxID=3062491 RepID=UPI002675FE22|nr:hypothetical protein [Mucilaginibacter sp. L3T2-6]MDO3643056.1 hypothetical protein [Mucilaginibacter sp. L3T2-6]MDV6215823.1 hypothetical protein [Mucilaginibacter sp. L3T2-6]